MTVVECVDLKLNLKTYGLTTKSTGFFLTDPTSNLFFLQYKDRLTDSDC